MFNIEDSLRSKLLEQKGILTTEEMAREIHISSNTLSQILRGKLTKVSAGTKSLLLLWVNHTKILEEPQGRAK